MGAVVVVAFVVFRAVFASKLGWLWGDWGPQRAVLTGILPGLESGDVPTWNHRVSTGDAPLETYPAFGYLLTGGIAIATGMTDNLMTLMMAVAVGVHVLLALCVTRLALRLAPAPIAALVGILCLVDTGHISSGGVMGLLQWALFHSAVGQLFCLLAAIQVVDAVREPRLSRSVAIWIYAGLAAAAHPASLLVIAIMCVALVAVALLANDAPPRRALAALFHLGLGLALAALVWMPLGERMLMYGQHFSSPLAEPGRWLAERLRSPVPQTDYALVAYAGFLGIAFGLWSRRVVPVFVAATGMLMLLGLCEAPYTGLDLAPGQTVARLGAERFFQLSRPFVFVAAAYLIALLLRASVAAWRGADRRAVMVAGAVLGVLCAFGLRATLALGTSVQERAIANARAAAPDFTADREPLLAYLRAERAAMGASQFARAVVPDQGAWYLHIVAETGIPMFHMNPIPVVVGRERIEDLSLASLRRFNVRWVISAGGPADAGMPGIVGTDRKLGNFYVRELPAWDGQFARVERGAGRVTVTRLDDRAVEVELTGTDQPALVALGTGFYPRWRARAGDQRLPVYAYPATPEGHMHVAAAWIPPGKTVFTCDGPLPSDGKGRGISVLALLAAIAIIAGWSFRGPRRRILRRMARVRRALMDRRRTITLVVTAVVALALVVWGASVVRRPVSALEVGSGVRAQAIVEARSSNAGAWKRCAYRPLAGEYRCWNLVTVLDTVGTILNDHQPLWPFTTPAIYMRPAARVTGPIEVRIRMSRHLAGRYWAGGYGNVVRLEIEGEQAIVTDHQVDATFADRGDRDITIHAIVPTIGIWLTFVRYDTLHPARPFLRPPPDAPPSEIAASR
ncbi:MAG: hypothetical protein F9K40_03770 [Kofleriaceae bacterium]|nr:MAG: hypothetical protein F9K40_03770 [Kofleriaceae bacterium]